MVGGDCHSGETAQAGGLPVSLGTIARVYDWVYEIHSILWHLCKKYMHALGKVSVPLENLRIKPKYQTPTRSLKSIWSPQVVSHLSPILLILLSLPLRLRQTVTCL